MRIKYLFTLLYFFCTVSALFAQFSPVTLQGTEIRSMHSNILDREMEIYVKLPWSYEMGDKHYPVLFCTDANRTFPIYSTISLIYETPGRESNEIIMVGIGYKVSDDRNMALAEWALLRNRDLRPERSLESEMYWKDLLGPFFGDDYIYPESGHAAEFLMFIKEELIPFIDSNYKALESDRGIAGYSLGGLFSLYAMFNDDGTFNKYFAGSPSLIQSCIEYEKAYSNGHADLDAHLLMTVNETETNTHQGVRSLVDSLYSRGYPSLKVDTVLFTDEDHMSGGAAAGSRALRILYYTK